MTITAKYAGKCRRCGGAIKVGEVIEWKRGGGSTHAECPENPAPAPECRTPAMQLPDVDTLPAGRYAVGDGDPPQLYKLWRGSRNPAVVRVYSLQVDGHSVHEYEVPRSDYPDVCKAIVEADPAEAAVRFGHHVGSCSRCGLRLTDRISIELGIGPICGRRLFGEAFKGRARAARERIREAGHDPNEKIEEEVAR